MVKRAVKRRTKKITTLIVILLAAVFVIVLIFVVSKLFIPAITPKSSKAPDKIIKPSLLSINRKN